MNYTPIDRPTRFEWAVRFFERNVRAGAIVLQEFRQQLQGAHLKAVAAVVPRWHFAFLLPFQYLEGADANYSPKTPGFVGTIDQAMAEAIRAFTEGIFEDPLLIPPVCTVLVEHFEHLERQSRASVGVELSYCEQRPGTATPAAS